MTVDSKPQTVGGDEYYVTYTGHTTIPDRSLSPHAVAHIVDLGNGSYELQFSQPLVPISIDSEGAAPRSIPVLILKSK